MSLLLTNAAPLWAQPAAAQQPSPIKLEYVLPDSPYVVAIRPKEILDQPGVNTIVADFPPFQEMKRRVPLPLEQVEQVSAGFIPQAVVMGLDRPPGLEGVYLIVRAVQPMQWDQVIEDRRALHKYRPGLVIKGEPFTWNVQGWPHFWTELDDRTLLIAEHEVFPRVLEAVKAAQEPSPYQPLVAQMGAAQMVVALRPNWVVKNISGVPMDGPEPGLAAGSIAPLWQQTERCVVAVDLNSTELVRGLAISPTEADAQAVRETLFAVTTIAKNAGSHLMDEQLREVEGFERFALAALAATVKQTLKNIRIEQAGTEVRLTVPTSINIAQAAQLLAPLIEGASESQQRLQSSNNLKQIALAMLNYEAAMGHFPPPYRVHPETGAKTSWRVLILPFLEQQALYDRYDFSKPWDDEANRLVAESIVEVYQAPGDDPASLYSGYYVFVGDDTIFPASKERGLNIGKILDGTSRTILVVEAKRETHWAAPEDIPFDAEKPLPKLEGFDKDSIRAVFADGAVRQLSREIDPKLLKALITRNGGEMTELDD